MPPQEKAPRENYSVMASITESTPPHVVAALRLIEEGRKLLEAGEEDKALDPLERAVAIAPLSPHGYYFLARAHLLKKNFRQALAFADKAETLFGRDTFLLGETYFLKGAAYEGAGLYPKARQAYRTTLTFSPRHVGAVTGLTRLGDSP